MIHYREDENDMKKYRININIKIENKIFSFKDSFSIKSSLKLKNVSNINKISLFLNKLHIKINKKMTFYSFILIFVKIKIKYIQSKSYVNYVNL